MAVTVLLFIFVGLKYALFRVASAHVREARCQLKTRASFVRAILMNTVLCNIILCNALVLNTTFVNTALADSSITDVSTRTGISVSADISSAPDVAVNSDSIKHQSPLARAFHNVLENTLYNALQTETMLPETMLPETMLPAVQVHHKFNEMIVFGDSLSDQGNAMPFLNKIANRLYPEGRFTNGRVAVEYVADFLALPLAASRHLMGQVQGNNFAVATAAAAGAALHDVPQQVSHYLHYSGGAASSETLYFFIAGGNDVMAQMLNWHWLSSQERIAAAAQGLVQQVERLIAVGATDFFIVDVPNISRTPLFNRLPDMARFYAWWMSMQYNRSLNSMLVALENQYPDVNITRLNTFELSNTLLEHPDRYGIANVTDACYASLRAELIKACADAEGGTNFAFWDWIHPSAIMHAYFGQAMIERLKHNYAIPDHESLNEQ